MSTETPGDPARKSDEMSSAALNTLLVTQLTKSLQVQERDLRWKNMRFFIIMGSALLFSVVYFTSLYLYIFPGNDQVHGDYAAMVRIEGVIDATGKASAEKINPSLVKAFKDKKAKGVVLLINSPGGSPVQSALINDRIHELRAQYPKKKVVVVAEDMLTSGSYYIATAVDKIYVNRSTTTGSVGVIAAQFGFPKILDRIGVERRVITAGIDKDRFDQFLPLKKEDSVKIAALLKQIHENFIDAVMETRKNKIKLPPDKLFTGDFWTGEEAVKLGLVDAIGDLPTVLKNEFGVEDTKDYTQAPGIFDRLGGMLTLSLRDLFLSEDTGLVLR
ncbi:MAG: S49 family peptidase [Sulfuricaulis sp.]